jgi:methionyl-tRNA formyltransferase
MKCARRAVVFANHDVGVRCLSVLLASGLDVPLVVAHREEPHESDLFASVSEFAALHGVESVISEDTAEPELLQRVSKLAPDFVFSFYYRRLLSDAMLATPRRGALNMHGSLLPKYRGRAPVNWAVIRGESVTGATLHYMTAKADAGDIVDQQPVPILPDDTAFDVFTKVTFAAELVLWRSLPALIAGNAPRQPQDISMSNYFGRRRPQDGEIDWAADARAVHNLVRGVAPPYPGAYAQVRGRTVRILRTVHETARAARGNTPALYVENGQCYIECAGGGVLRVLSAEVNGRTVSPAQLPKALGAEGIVELETRIAEKGAA